MRKFMRRMFAFLMIAVLGVVTWGVSPAFVKAAAVTPETGNIYYIKNKNSGLYLTVEGDSASNGANVVQATGTGSVGQRWILEKNSNGTYRIHPATDMTGGVSLDVANGSTSNGANIQIWSNNSLGYTPYTGCNIYSEKNYFDKGSYAGKVVDDKGVGVFTDSGSVLSSDISSLATAATSWRPSSNYGYATRSASDAKTWAQNYAGAQDSKIVYAID